MERTGRFAFGDPWYRPWELFRPFMLELTSRYPSYGLVFDRDEGKWVVYQQDGSVERKIVAKVEDGDGTALPPSMEFLDELTKTDVIRQFGDKKAYLAWIRKEIERVRAQKWAQFHQDCDYYAAKPIRDYLAGGARQQYVLRPLEEPHRKQIEASLNAH